MTLVAALIACSEPQPRESRLVIADDGRYVLNGKTVPPSDLRRELQALKVQGAQLHVVGGENVKYEHVAAALKVVQEEGLARVEFISEPLPTAAESTSRPPL